MAAASITRKPFQNASRSPAQPAAATAPRGGLATGSMRHAAPHHAPHVVSPPGGLAAGIAIGGRTPGSRKGERLEKLLCKPRVKIQVMRVKMDGNVKKTIAKEVKQNAEKGSKIQEDARKCTKNPTMCTPIYELTTPSVFARPAAQCPSARERKGRPSAMRACVQALRLPTLRALREKRGLLVALWDGQSTAVVTRSNSKG